MEIVNLLGGAMGLSFVAGINLYATILAVGLGVRTDLIHLAPGMESLEMLGHPLILVVAGAMYAAEFFADKVPWVDSAWDTVHTFVRPLGGAMIGAAALGEVDPAVETAVFLLSGGVAFSSHATKASTRLLVNQSPEPFTNTAVSLAEDVLAIGGAWLALQHPAVMLVIVLACLAAIAYFGPKILRLVRLECLILARLLANLFRGKPSPEAARRWDHLPDKYRPALPDGIVPREAQGTLRGVSGAGTPLGRNLVGYVVLQEDRLAFATRKWFRPRAWELDLREVDEAWVETKLLLHRLSLVRGGQTVRFAFFRDRTERAQRLAELVRARVDVRRAASDAAPAAGDTPPLEEGGAPA